MGSDSREGKCLGVEACEDESGRGVRMIDLDKIVPFFGTVESRGMVGVKWLKENNHEVGFFHQNERKIVVYRDSTERELTYQYAYALRQR